jgi:two-component system, NtrC family, response regulator
MSRDPETTAEDGREPKPRLLIVDDDPAIGKQMKWAYVRDYDVTLASDRESALAAFRRSRPAVVTLDLGLPPSPHEPSEGFATLAAMLEEDPIAKVIVITGQSEKANAIEAIGRGAFDFLCKPIEIDELAVTIRRAASVGRLERDHRALQQRRRTETLDELIGSSPAIAEIFAAIRKLATTDAAVLILGETGTGKELVARAIHRRSARGDGPFVAINCGAIPETLLESELFGYERGAFTGAHAQRKGRIELAQGGTLLLDEIGELPPSLQVKLLRFLQEQKIQRIGGRADVSVDVRVLAATNVDLRKAISEARFREDLFYRLSVVSLSVPPLRDRRDDVLLLARAFLARFSPEAGKRISGFSGAAVDALVRHPWPGNVRELENRVRRAVIMTDERWISPADLDLDAGPAAELPATLREARSAVEREMIQRSIRRNQGNLTQVANELGISRPTLYDLMEKLGIDRDAP